MRTNLISSIYSIASVLLFLVVISSCQCIGASSPNQSITKGNPDFINECIQNSKGLQFVTIVSVDKMSRCFKQIGEENESQMAVKQPKFLKSVIARSADEIWSYEANIKDSSSVNQFIAELNTRQAFPPTIHFVWSYYQNTDSTILLFAFESYGRNPNFLSGKDILKINRQYDEQKKPVLFIQFNNEAANVLRDYTSDSIGNYFGILINSRVVAYRLIKNEISGSVLIVD